MKFKTLILAVAMCGVFGFNSTSAQTAEEVIDSEKLMMSPSSPCNQGAEPFSQFIQKFSTDKEFMESRLNLTDAVKAQYAEVLVPESFKAMEPVAKDGDMWYQAWGEIQFGRVYLDCGWVDSFAEHTFEFKRQGDKWYLAKIVVD